MGAATASKELGIDGKLKIVSMDRDDGTLKFIEDGVIDASVAQKSALMTFYGTMLMDGLKYNPVPIVADNKAADVLPDARGRGHRRGRHQQGQRQDVLPH